jgi:hypothetical protein
MSPECAEPEPKCERCYHRYPDVVTVDVPGEGARAWCPECISDYMQDLERQAEHYRRAADYYEEELRIREANACYTKNS